MATKTATVSTGDWNYIDKFGDPHPVTNGETFTFELTDTSATDVTFYVNQAQSVATDDGYLVNFRTETNIGNTQRVIGPMADTQDATATPSIKGEMVMECPKSGDKQRWTMRSVNIDNVDAPTELTEILLEDQFGNAMTMATIAVA